MQTVSSFEDMLRQFTTGNVLYLLSVIALLIFFFKSNKNERKIFIGTILLLVLVIFNPISFQIICSKLGFLNRYYRFMWILPYNITIAYLLFESIRTIKKDIYKLLVVIITSFLIISNSGAFYLIHLPQNIYQLPTDVMEVAFELEDLMEKNEQSQIRIIADVQVSNSIREYNADICLPLERWDFSAVPLNLYNAMPFSLMAMLIENRTDIVAEEIERGIEDYKIDYLVIPTQNQDAIYYMQCINCVIVGGTTNYTIMQCME